ncbi:hypothetical protein GCM10008014_30390 [Paenibacillus silvae]|uniref:Uncharacterized protein n=1 Tax=Paenibacillus silvae TaxID=1325358 RepID=A0ABQ1ZCE8_9BACL|nr:hypothetical protein GCM10008014_30390 [Paenibacillus silvae]
MLIEKYKVSGGVGHDYTEFFDKSGFMLFRPYQYDLIPRHDRLNQEWFKQRDDLILTMDNCGNKHAFFGAIFFRPYRASEIEDKVFKCNNSWLGLDSRGLIQPFEYIGGYQDDFSIYKGAQIRIFHLPEELKNKEAIGLNEISSCFGTNRVDSAMLINELICQEYLLDR